MPQSNRQHAVPQNIMDVEFKLIGDLTMRQFSYLMLLGLSAYLCYLVIPGIFKWPTVIILILLALSLAFVPIQERGLDEWLVNFFRAVNSPTQRIWRKEPQVPTAFLYDNLAVVKQELITLAPTSSRRKLEEYLKYRSDEGVIDPLDIPEKSYVMKVREAYPDAPKPSGVGVLLEEPEFEEEEIPEEVDKELIQESKEEVVEVNEVTPKTVSTPITPEFTSEAQASRVPLKEPEEKKDETPRILTRSRSVYGRPSYGGSRKLTSGSGAEYEGYEMITPDMHSGRKFVNLIPTSGQITLPIRGEKILETSESIQVKGDLEEKTLKLKELLEKIRIEEGLVPSKISKTVNKNDEVTVVDEQAQEVVEKLKKQNEDLSSEIDRLRGQIERGKTMSIETSAQEQLLKKLESQKGEIASSYSELVAQVQDLKKKLQEQTKVSTGEDFIESVKNQLPVLTTKPNVLTGIVRDKEGKFLSEMLLIVKNSRGDTVRAFKTNSMGQFVVSTPLQNGTYTVEVSPSNKTSLTFGIIPLEVKGEVIPALDVASK